MNRFKEWLFTNVLKICIVFFLIMLASVSFIDTFEVPFDHVPSSIAFFFWFSFGLMVGCYWMREAFLYLNKAKDKE